MGFVLVWGLNDQEYDRIDTSILDQGCIVWQVPDDYIQWSLIPGLERSEREYFPEIVRFNQTRISPRYARLMLYATEGQVTLQTLLEAHKYSYILIHTLSYPYIPITIQQIMLLLSIVIQIFNFLFKTYLKEMVLAPSFFIQFAKKN